MRETQSRTGYKGLLCHSQELEGILWVTEPQKGFFWHKVVRTYGHLFHLYKYISSIFRYVSSIFRYISSTKYLIEIGDINKSFHLGGGKNQIH